MKKIIHSLAFASFLFTSVNTFAQTNTRFNDGYLTVFKATSGSALTNTGTAIIAEEYDPTTATQATPNYSVALPTSTGNKLVVSGTGTSAGGMTRSQNGRYLVMPGYNGLVGDLNSTFTTNGTIRTLNGSGTVGAGISGGGTTLWLSGSNSLRGATSDDGTNYWFSGNAVGVQTSTNGTTLTTVSTTSTNNRDVFIFNGQLYSTTGAGTQGIYSVGSGTPIITGQTSALLFTPTNTDVYSFSISPDSATIYYVASTSGGIYKSTYNGTTWSAETQIFSGTSYTSIAVDWSNYTFSSSAANGARIFACKPSQIIAANDNGLSTLTTTILRTEPITADNAFRQLTFSPVKQTVTLGTNTPIIGNLDTSSTNVVLFQFNLNADEGNSTVKKIIMNQTGTATIGAGNDIRNFRLIQDANNNGIAESGEISASLATGTVSGNTITFGSIALSNYITEGTSVNFLVIGDVPSTATNGHTFIPEIISNKTLNGINYTSNITNAGSSWVNSSNNGIIGNALTINTSSSIITLNTTNFNGAFGTYTVSSSSPSSPFLVSATGLTANLIITPPVGFEIRTGSNAFSTSPITLTPTAGNVPVTTIDVRFTPLTAVVYSGNVTCTSTGANTQNAPVSGTGVLSLATKLKFVNVPTTGLSATNLASFTVEARKSDNSVDATFTGIITVAKAFGNGTLSGTTAVSAVAGVATFNAIQFNIAGADTLYAAATGLTKDTSGAIVLTTPLPVSITEVILPQYMEGNSSSNTTRLPFIYRATLNNLLPNATYRYYNTAVASTDISTYNGVGNCIFPRQTGFRRTTSTSLVVNTGYDSLTTDANGSYTGWFSTEPTGNARFTNGNSVFMRIILNNGASGSTAAYRVTTTDSVQVLKLSSSPSDGTGLRGNSSAIPKNFVLLYDNTNGNGRPISGTYVESDSVANTTANSYASFYATSVNGVPGAYGAIIPNSNPNGIVRIEQRDFATAAVVGCPSIAPTGTWPSGANTVIPTGGTTEIVIVSSDAPLDTATTTVIAGITSATIDTVCAGTNSGTLTLSGNTGNIVKWQYSIDNFSSDIHNITNTTASQAFSNLTQTTYYRAAVGGGCSTAYSTASQITVIPLPIVTFGPFGSSICSTQTALTLTGGVPAGGVYSGTGVSSGIFNATVSGTGTFTITYTVTSGSCSNTATQSLIVSTCTGVQENGAGNIDVYPNPTNGMFTITIKNANVNELLISVVDIRGQEVYKELDKNSTNDYNKQINLEGLAKGIYFIKLTSTNSNLKIQKLVIE